MNSVTVRRPGALHKWTTHFLRILAVAGCFGASSTAKSQTIHLYNRLLDPLAIARLDAPDFSPPKATFGIGFGYGKDADYPDYYLYAQDTGAGVINHLFLTTRTPDSLTDYKLIVDGAVLREASSYQFFLQPHGYIQAPLDTIIGEARICDVQIPFRHGFKLLYKTPDYLTWYDYTWRTLPATVSLPVSDVQSTVIEQEEARADSVFEHPAQLWRGVTGVRDTAVETAILAGREASMILLQGSGIVNGLWINPMGYDSSLDSVWLDIYYDGAVRPAFSTPLLALFGHSFTFRPMHSLPIDFSKDSGFAMRLPMPFAHAIQISVRNLSTDTVILRCSLSYFLQPVDPSMLGYLHAAFSEVNPTRFHIPHHVLHRKGKGRYIGILMGIHGLSYLETLEGDPIFTIDSIPEHSFQYEGTEDYFNGAQYFSNGPFLSPFAGNTGEDFYRFHYLDAFDFRTSFDFDFQSANDNDAHEDYRTVAFWYERNIPYWTDRDTIRNGEIWHIAGAGYGALQTISILLDSTEIDRSSAGADGVFDRWITVPSGLHGFFRLSVNGVSYPEAVLVSATPTVQLVHEPTPIDLQTGDTLQLVGEGFETGDSIEVTIKGMPIASQCIVRSNHRMSGWATMPDVPDGDYHVTLSGAASGLVISDETVHLTRTLTFDCEDLWDTNSSPTGTSKFFCLINVYPYLWRHEAVVRFRPGPKSGELNLRFRVPLSDTFATAMVVTQGKTFGDFDILFDGTIAGHSSGYASFDHTPDTIPIGLLYLHSGYHSLTFRYTGHAAGSTDSVLWADYLRLAPISTLSDSGPSSVPPIDRGLSIYPDPAGNWISINSPSILSETARIGVVDMLGKEVLQTEVRRVDGAFGLSTSTLPAGAYVLTIQDHISQITGTFRVVR